MTNINLIPSPGIRELRKQTKQKNILRFLRQNLWSTQEVLQKIMPVESRQAAHKSLKKMQDEGLIKSHRLEVLGGNITLWGITPHGQSMAFDPDCEKPNNAYFEPSRVSELMIRHQLDLQNLRVCAEKNRWTDWRDGDRLGPLNKDIKRPDAIAKTPNSVVVAIECERTFKTTKRYEQILVSYLRLLKSQHIAEVVWVLPTSDMVTRLKKIILGIKSVRVAGHNIQIDPAKHHTRLHFCSYADWPRYE